MNGVIEWDIMRQTGHTSTEMLAMYIRIGEMFTPTPPDWGSCR
jgi:hypothetical protein